MVIAVGKDMWWFHECAEVILTVTLAAGWTLLVLKTGYNSLTQYGEFLAPLKYTP